MQAPSESLCRGEACGVHVAGTEVACRKDHRHEEVDALSPPGDRIRGVFDRVDRAAELTEAVRQLGRQPGVIDVRDPRWITLRAGDGRRPGVMLYTVRALPRQFEW
jgi:hypothetical protein